MELYATVAVERPQQILAVFIRDARGPVNGEQPQPVEDPVGATTQSRWKNYTHRSDSTGSTKSGRQTSRDASDDATPVQLTMTPGQTPNYQPRQRSTSYGKRQNSVDYFNQPDRSSPGPSNTNDNGSPPWLSGTQAQEEPGTGEIDTSVGLGPKPAKMSDVEWKRLELQMRVDRARMGMPQSVKFRLFTKPEECVEAFELLDWSNKKGPGNKPDLSAAVRVGPAPPDAQSDSRGELRDI